MTKLNDTIEAWSFEDLDNQKKACANVKKSEGDWTSAEEDCYTMGYETGARRMAKEWAKRFQVVGRLFWCKKLSSEEYTAAREMGLMQEEILYGKTGVSLQANNQGKE